MYMAMKVIVNTGYFDSQVQFRTNFDIMDYTINLFSFTCKLKIGEESKFAPCKVIRITLVFRIPTLSILNSNLEYSGFQPLVFRILVSRILQIPFKNR